MSSSSQEHLSMQWVWFRSKPFASTGHNVSNTTSWIILSPPLVTYLLLWYLFRVLAYQSHVCGISIVSSQKLLELVMHHNCAYLNLIKITFRLEISSLNLLLLNCYDLKISPTSYGIRGRPNTYNASTNYC